MTSVTTVLDTFPEPFLIKWHRSKGFAACDKISEEAKRVGKVVDAIIQANLRGTNLEWDHTQAQVVNCVNAWQQFKEERPLFCSQVTGIQTELTEGEIVGHPDLIMTEPARWGIVDVKTSKAIYPRYWVQTGKYWSMKRRQLANADSMAGCRLPSFIAILRLDKESGRYEYREMTEERLMREQVIVFNAYWRVYQHAQQVREWMRDQAESEVLDGS